MIDEEKTFAEKGYYSTDLSFGSHKTVWAICEGEDCENVDGRGRWVEIKAYRALCPRCASKLQRIYDYDENVVRSIDEEKTFADKGYRSTDLSAQSHKKVWAICIVCGIGRWLEFKQYGDMCHWCAMRTDEHRAVVSEMRKGTTMPPITDEARANMSKAQTGLSNTVESRHNMSVARKKFFTDPVNREKLSAAIQGIPYDEWEGFARDKPYCPAFDETCKESNREKYDRLCFLCGKEESDNIMSSGANWRLSVHHVDMNKDQGCNGHEWKLVPLCISCHNKSHNIFVMNRIIYLLNNVWNTV